MLTQTITLDVLNKIPTETILCRYGETGRKIRFLLTNSETETTISPSAFSVKFQLYKPDGNFIIKDADTVTSEYVEVELDEQTTASAGVGYADLKLTSNGIVIYTCHVSITIDTPVATDETIVSLSMIDGYIFPDDFQLKLTAGRNIYFTDENTINARASSMIAGEGLTIDGDTVSIDSETLSKIEEVDDKQNILTAGAGISIENDVISSTSQGMEMETIVEWSGTYTATQTIPLSKQLSGYKLVVIELVNPAGTVGNTLTCKPSNLPINVQTVILWYAQNSFRNFYFTLTDSMTLRVDNAGIGGGATYGINIYGLK